MKHIKSILLSAVALLAIVSPHAEAAVKVGAPCSKIGQVSPTKNPQFKCLFVSGKKKWMATKSNPEKVAISVSWPLAQPAKSVEEILAIADSAERRYTADAKEVLPVELLTGPSTDRKIAEEYIKPLNTAMTLWSKDFLPAKPLIVALAEVQDFQFMKELWIKNEIGAYFDSSEATWSRNGKNCNQGAAKNDPYPFFWGCLPTDVSSFNVIGLKKFTPHEYAHIVQMGIYKEASGGKFGNLPTLFSEGSADFYGVTFASTSTDIAKNWDSYRTYKYINSSTAVGLKTANNDQIYSYLLDSMKDSKLAPGHWYFTGAYATARLIAAKGHEGFVQYMKENGKLRDPFKSFQNVYGITFEEFARMISPEIIQFAQK